MIYIPPKDYYKLVVGCKVIDTYPFDLDSESMRCRAYQAARDEYDRQKEKKGGQIPRDRHGRKRMRIIRWANGNLFQVHPDAKPPKLRLVGTELAGFSELN